MLHKRDFWAGGAFLVLGLALLFVLIPVGVDAPRKVQIAALAPSYYPNLIAIAMAVLGLAIVVRAVMSNGDNGRLAGAPAAAVAKVCSVVLVLFATAYLLPFLGFVLASTIALIVLMLLAGERNPVTVALVAVLLPAVLYLFFTKLANIPIPGGVLDPILLRI